MVKGTNNNKKADIKGVALNLLSYRAHSVFELRAKLKKRSFEDSEIETLTRWLLEMGYLNDEVFATELASSRARNKNWGTIRIRADLKRRAVAGEHIEGAVEAISGLVEAHSATRAIRKWLAIKGLTLPLGDGSYQRAFRHLQGKGFPAYVIIKTLKTEENTDDI